MWLSFNKAWSPHGTGLHARVCCVRRRMSRTITTFWLSDKKHPGRPPPFCERAQLAVADAAGRCRSPLAIKSCEMGVSGVRYKPCRHRLTRTRLLAAVFCCPVTRDHKVTPLSDGQAGFISTYPSFVFIWPWVVYKLTSKTSLRYSSFLPNKTF